LKALTIAKEQLADNAQAREILEKRLREHPVTAEAKEGKELLAKLPAT
jgi:hypothetical protein